MIPMLSRNCVLTRNLDSYCLICSTDLPDDESILAHIQTLEHQTTLKNNTYIENYKDDCIKKVNDHYFCEMCNMVFPTDTKVDIHVTEQTHLINKKKQFRRVGTSIVFQNKIMIEEKAWNGFVQDTCILCSDDSDDYDDYIRHKSNSIHTLNVIRNKVIVDDENNLYRKVGNHGDCHCLTCNIVIPQNELKEHLNSVQHKNTFIKYEQNIKNDQIKNKNDENGKENIISDSVEKSDNDNSLENEKHEDIIKKKKKEAYENILKQIPDMLGIFHALNKSCVSTVEQFDNDNSSELERSIKELSDIDSSSINESRLDITGKQIDNDKRSKKEALENIIKKISNIDSASINESHVDITGEQIDSDNSLKVLGNVIKEIDSDLKGNSTVNESCEDKPSSTTDEMTLSTVPDEPIVKAIPGTSKSLDVKVEGVTKQHDMIVNKDNPTSTTNEMTLSKKSKRKKAKEALQVSSKPIDAQVEAIAKQNDLIVDKDSFKVNCKVCTLDIPAMLHCVRDHVTGKKHKERISKQIAKQHNLKNVKRVKLTNFMKHFTYTERLLEHTYAVINQQFCIKVLNFLGYGERRQGESYKCQFCDVVLNSDEESRKHENAELHINSYVITSLEKEFVRQVKPNLFHCGYCGQITETFEQMLDHLDTTEHASNRAEHERTLRIMQRQEAKGFPIWLPHL